MLHDFLTSNRRELISRCKAKVAKRSPKASSTDDPGVPLFLQQLADFLYREHLATVRTEPATERTPALTEIGRAAALHGADLLRRGYSVGQVVHEYGDVCQAVTELGVEQNARFTVDEFRTLNRCLDNAIADAVTAFASNPDGAMSERADNFFKNETSTNEQRRLINLAIQIISAIQTGHLGANGTTATTLLNTLCDLRDLIDPSPPLDEYLNQ
jgi:hypothetical protein